MSLTPEQLLAPRWEVIADYPYSPWEKGDILCADEEGELHGYNGSCGYPESSKKITIHAAELHPSIFRQMQWWEKRSLEDMSGITRLRHLHWFYVTVIEHFTNSNANVCLAEREDAPGNIYQYDYRWFWEPTNEHQKQKA